MDTSRFGVSLEHVRLGLFALFGLGFLALSVPAFIEPMTFWTGIVLGEYAFPDHELHHLVLGVVFPALLLGVVMQAHRPARRVGALHTSLAIWLSLTVVFAIGGAFSPIQLVLLGLLLGMAVTHPVGRRQLPSVEAPDRPLAVLAAGTALGALAFGALELNAHFVTGDSHVAFGHYLFMATASLSTAILVCLVPIRPTCWRYPAYTAAAFLTVFGVGSVLYPGAAQGSSLGSFGVLVVLWALLFLAVAEREVIAPGLG